MGKSRPLERVQFANQIQGFRILNCWEAGEKIQTNIWVSVIFPHTWLFGVTMVRLQRLFGK